ncbi:MAG: Hsp20/alpha crystallin family protein [Ignavibacteria bacterium]|jgi:HSP20 family protein
MTQNKEKTASFGKLKSWEEALENELWINPVVDIFETEHEFYLLAQLPGVEKNNMKIKLEDGNLLIMGRINYEETLNRNYTLKESETGNYFRKFNLSDSIDSEKINANYENGLLTVKLPKKDKVKPKVIDIK